MNLSGKTAMFRLSPRSEDVLKPVVGNQPAFEALIMSADSLGLWIDAAPKGTDIEPHAVGVFLVKWEYVATLEIEMSLEPPPPRTVIGFKPL